MSDIDICESGATRRENTRHCAGKILKKKKEKKRNAGVKVLRRRIFLRSESQ